MSTEPTTEQPAEPTKPKQRTTAEERVERFFTYWADAWLDAFRIVFRPREDNK